MCGLGGRRAFDEVGIREIAEDPIAALPKDLGVRVESFDFLAWNGGHEAVFDTHEDLRTNAERGIDKKIEGGRYRPFGGVFDGNHSIAGMAAGDVVKNLGEVGLRGVFNGMAKLGNRSLVGPSAFGAEEGNLKVVFERQSGRHNLAVDRANRFFGETAVIFGSERLKKCIFALGSVDLKAFFFFDFADFVDGIGPLREEVEQFGVDRVDRFADFVEWHGIRDLFFAGVGIFGWRLLCFTLG